MSKIGYYRYKNVFNSNTELGLYVNGELESIKNVYVRDWCEGNILLKYINKNGQYRFFPFNKYWEREDKPKEIGKANKIIVSLLEDQSSQKSVGYKNERALNLVAESVTQDELEILNDIYTSPNVFVYIGINTDTIQDWLQVTIESRKPSSKIKKGNVTDVELSVVFPEWYSIGLL